MTSAIRKKNKFFCLKKLNYKKVGDCFEHEKEEIVSIYPAISMESDEDQAEVARVEIMTAILNVEE